MPIEKKNCRVTSSVTEETEFWLRSMAEREDKTLSEFLDDMYKPFVDREKKYVLSIATELNLVNVNDISMGYEVNQKKKVMYSRSKPKCHLYLVAAS